MTPRSTKSTDRTSHLPTGKLGKDGIPRAADRKKSVLGPSREENTTLPDDVVLRTLGKYGIYPAADRKKSILVSSREENKTRPDDVVVPARRAKMHSRTASNVAPRKMSNIKSRPDFDVRSETASAEDDKEQVYELYSHMLRREMEHRLERKEGELEDRLGARFEREVEARVEVALASALRELRERYVLGERECRTRLEAEHHMRVREGVNATHAVAKHPTNRGLIIVSTLSQKDDVWSVILSVKPHRWISPYRTISDPDIGDPARMYLGANGKLEVHMNVKTRARRAVYYDAAGDVNFMAECPTKEPHHAIQGNAGKESMFVWDAVNEAHESGGTTIRGAVGRQAPGHRRFFFYFETNATLAVTLHHIMGHQRYTEEFFSQGTTNRFRKTVNLPAHHVVSTLSSASPNVRRMRVNSGQLMRKYDGVDPTNPSQPM